MDNETILDIKQQFMNFLELEDIRHIDVHLKNGSLVSCNTNNDVDFQETGFLYSFSMEDGCSFKYYIPYENIVYISATYDCPRSIPQGE